MQTVSGLILLVGLVLAMFGFVGPGSSPTAPVDGQTPPLPIQPSLARPSGPSSTI